jgi:hypothetical protein
MTKNLIAIRRSPCPSLAVMANAASTEPPWTP